MGSNSSIYKTWIVTYEVEGTPDAVFNAWRVSFRGYMYLAIVLALCGWTAINIFSYFARRKRLKNALDLILQEDKRRQYNVSLPMSRSTSSLSKDSKDSSKTSGCNVTVLPVSDMSRSNSSTTLNSFSTITHSKSTLTAMNRYPVIERSATALRWAALQAFFRTHFTWRRIGFGSYNAAVSELFWFFIYFGCMLLLGFLFLPETNQAQNTNVTIHRCSSLAVSQIPFVIGLASKNNVISWLTGLSYERLNFMHRNAARVLWVYSCYHTFGHIYLGLTGLHHLHQWYVGFGVVAFTAFNLIIILSFRPIRNRIYEVFLYSHICLVVIFIVSLLLHRMEYRGWIGVSLAIWSLDRFSRLLRIFAINRLWLILKGTVLDKSKASCELVTPELIRLSIPKDFGWKSGKHAFLCLPTISTLPFEFHPFTIGSLKRMDNERSSEVNFFIRVCNGMTKQLALRIERMGGHCEVPVLVDGPYGSSKNLHHFDEVLLVSGGTGVSYTFNRLSELAAKRIDKLSAVRKVTFVWVTRKAGEIALLEDLLVEILEATPPGFLDLQIYVTDKNFGRQCEKGGRSSFGRLGRYMKAGRPQMQRIVWQHITNKAGQVAIHCCGPSPLSDSARIALADILSPSAVQTEKCAAVDLHVETFGF